MEISSDQLLNQENSKKWLIYTPSRDISLDKNNSNNKKQGFPLNYHKNKKNKKNLDKNEINNNYNNININKTNSDPRLQLTLVYLDIESFLPIFTCNNITFNDLLLLSRNDLIDLGLPIIERNRILHFSQQFIKYGKNYTINEINSFFEENKNLYSKTMLNNSNNSNNISYNKNKQSTNYSQRNNIKSKCFNIKNIKENKLYKYSNGFEASSNNFNNNDKDSQQEIDYCHILPRPIGQSKTNISSKNNIYSSLNGVEFFPKYKELTQEIDNFLNKYNEYKQNWLYTRKKYENLMYSYIIKYKSTVNKKNKNCNKINENNFKDINVKESFEKLKSLRERKEELKRQLEKIEDKSNHKKMIIKYLDENE